MSVFKMKDKPHGGLRKRPWCCELPDPTGKRYRRYFTSKQEAQAYEAKEKERRRTSRTGMHSIQDLRKYTVREIVEAYYYSKGYTVFLDEDGKDDYRCPDEDNDLYENYFLVLWAFARDAKYSSLNLYDFNKEVAEQYRDDMLSKTYVSNGSTVEKKYSPRTVRRNITIIQRAWKWAKKYHPGLTALDNPWEGLKVAGATGGKRQRGLKKGEFQALIKGCEKCRGVNRYYVELAISFVVETGLRRQELENLTWGDIDFPNRRISINKTKTDKVTGNEGRIIVLPLMIELKLKLLYFSLARHGRLPAAAEKDQLLVSYRPIPTEPIFPMSGDALSDAFDGVVDRTGLQDLHFHDLRSAAEMKFYRAGLIPKEIDIIKNGPKGHYDVLDIYLEVIQDKLDKHVLGGKTLEEAEKEHNEGWTRLIVEGIQQGLDEDTSIRAVGQIYRSDLKRRLEGSQS
ncbi:tyrosine-type recombinase/integrase [Bradyrhizobium cenepequi]